MGREIVYCESCGERILEKEIQQGSAVTFLNKNYCSLCKEKAIQESSGAMSRDEFQKLVMPKEEKKEEKASTSRMKTVKPEQPIVSRAGAAKPPDSHSSPRIASRISQRSEQSGRSSYRSGKLQRPPAKQSNTWLFVALASLGLLIFIVIILLASRK